MNAYELPMNAHVGKLPNGGARLLAPEKALVLKALGRSVIDAARRRERPGSHSPSGARIGDLRRLRQSPGDSLSIATAAVARHSLYCGDRRSQASMLAS